MPDEKKPFWTSLPGILTGLATVITAITGLYVAIYRNGEDAEKTRPLPDSSAVKQQEQPLVNPSQWPELKPIPQIATPRGVFMDSNGDGKMDMEYWGYDTNNDGVQDYGVYDTNLNGKIDQYVYYRADQVGGKIYGFDLYETSVIDHWGWDTDNDGRVDTWGWDKNGNQVFDTWGWDTNGDGQTDRWGYDPNEDGIIDQYQ